MNRLLVNESKRDAKVFWLLSLAGTVGLFPLLFTPRDVIAELLLTGVYGLLSFQRLELALSPLDGVALVLLAAGVFAYCACPLLLPSRSTSRHM